MVKAMASASRGAPNAIATRRSNPKATPAQSGMPARSAASRRSSSGGCTWPRARAQGQVPVETRALLAGVGQFMKAVGEFEPVDVQLEARRDRRRPGFNRASAACEAG